MERRKEEAHKRRFSSASCIGLMLSTEACREHLADIPLTDAQIERLRDALYALVENVLDDYIQTSDTVNAICKKQ